MTQQVLILGAGFGGLELATRLSDSLRDEVQVTLVDQNDSFIFGFSKLEILFGRRTRDEPAAPTGTSPNPAWPTARNGSPRSIPPRVRWSPTATATSRTSWWWRWVPTTT